MTNAQILADDLKNLKYEEMVDLAEHLCDPANDWMLENMSVEGFLFDKDFFATLLIEWADEQGKKDAE